MCNGKNMPVNLFALVINGASIARADGLGYGPVNYPALELWTGKCWLMLSDNRHCLVGDIKCVIPNFW